MHIAQNWRIRHARYMLEGVRCDRCGTVLFPARATCPHCAAIDRASHSANIAQVDGQAITANSFVAETNTPWSQAAR